MRIYLIGFMGCGKSTVGKKLANILNYEFLDLDTIIEETYQLTIPFIFNKYDEKAFRALEQSSLIKTLSKNNCVIATGGGTPCFYDNIDLMNNNGITIFIQMHPKSLHQRLIHARKKRPLVEQKSADEVFNYINEELKNRNKFYQQAQIIIKGENLLGSELADKIKLLKP